MNKSLLVVEWTGCYPSLCFGEWIIKYNNQELNIPENIKEDNMNTHGSYAHWTFDEEYIEEWTYYEDGLDEEEWLQYNMEWIVPMFQEFNIEITNDLLSELFEKIQEQDWRHGSCGGCI